MFEKPVRNHPTYILERIGSYLLLLLLLLGNALTAGTKNTADLFRIDYWKLVLNQLLSGNFSVLLSAAGAVVILFAVIAVSILRWSRTFFRVEGELLYSERKTLIRKESKLPVGSITTVNVEQNVFEKAVGTAKVKIDINSAVTANKTDFIFILKKQDALALKETLLSKRDSHSERQEAAPKTLLAAFSAADALRHQLLSIPFIEILTGFMVIFPMFFGKQSLPLQEALPVLGVMAAVYIGSVIFGTLNLANFRLETDGRHIFISHGTLRTQNYTFEKSRVKAVFLKQGLLARLFGLCSVELAVVGLGNEKKESPRLCLLVSKDRAEELIAILLPAYTSTKTPLVSSKAALLPAVGLTLCCTAVSALLYFYIPLYGIILCAVVFVFGILAGVLSRKTRTLSMEEDLFCCSSGILNKKTGRFLYRDLQEVRFHTNAIMQKGQVGRMGFSILSARSMSTQKTGWFKEEIYESLCEKILSYE